MKRLWPILIPQMMLILLITPGLSSADSLESATTGGKGYYSQGLTYDSDKSDLTWSAGYSFSHTDPAAGTPQTTDNTSEFNGSLGWLSDSGFRAGGGLTYSTTPGESLNSFGPDVYVGYKLFLVDRDDFRPSIRFKLSGAVEKYTNDLTKTSSVMKNRKLVSTTKQTEVAINQRSLALQTGIAPLSWASIDVTWTAYRYDRDVPNFLSYLNTPQAVRAGTSGLGSDVSGFYLNSQEIALDLMPTESWDVTLSESLATSAVDGALSHFTKLMLSHDFSEAWTVGLGASRDVSPDDQQNAGYLTVDWEI